MTTWTGNEDGPACACGEMTAVKIMPDGEPVLMCLFHTKDAGAITRLPPAKPECIQPCDPDCEAGAAHCYWIHEPNHRLGWHSQDDCPVRVSP